MFLENIKIRELWRDSGRDAALCTSYILNQ